MQPKQGCCFLKEKKKKQKEKKRTTIVKESPICMFAQINSRSYLKEELGSLSKQRKSGKKKVCICLQTRAYKNAIVIILGLLCAKVVLCSGPGSSLTFRTDADRGRRNGLSRKSHHKMHINIVVLFLHTHRKQMSQLQKQFTL